MTGSALMDFLIGIIALALVVFMVFLAVDKLGPDEFSKKVAKVAVGGLALIMLLFAVKAVLFGGGGAAVIAPLGLINFAIGLIVVVVVVFLLYMAVDYFAAQWAEPIKYVVGAVALIAILLVAAQTVFGGGGWIAGPRASVSQPLTR